MYSVGALIFLSDPLAIECHIPYRMIKLISIQEEGHSCLIQKSRHFYFYQLYSSIVQLASYHSPICPSLSIISVQRNLQGQGEGRSASKSSVGGKAGVEAEMKRTMKASKIQRDVVSKES